MKLGSLETHPRNAGAVRQLRQLFPDCTGEAKTFEGQDASGLQQTDVHAVEASMAIKSRTLSCGSKEMRNRFKASFNFIV